MSANQTEAGPERSPSDLTRNRWKKLKRLLSPARPGGRPRSVKLREVLNGILLRDQVRRKAGRKTSLGMAVIDSRSIKATERGGPGGEDARKMASGRKRHLLVDTLGLIQAVVAHGADIQDRDEARLVLEEIKGCFSRLTMILAGGTYDARRNGT